MRFPAMMLGLAVLLAVPALLAVPDAASGQRSPAKAKAAAKKAASKTKKASKPPPTPAKLLFAAAKTPAPLAARSIGFYAKGCLAGAQALPIDGPAWQAMRLSRNRNWGHPELIKLIERFAVEAKQHDGWPGLLVGDISQPRGGPMSSGHASHQVGLDADLWFTPMPDRRLSEKEREEISATSMLAEDHVSVNPKVWTEAHVRILKRAASYPQVERVLVHPAIKKAVCDASTNEKDRGWLSKIRPYWGHYYHFHVRIACPKGSSNCERQPSVNDDNDGCGAELTQWLKRIKPPKVADTPPPPKPAKPAPERRPITLDQLPAECRAVLASGTPVTLPSPARADARPEPKSAPAAKDAGSPADASGKAEPAAPAAAAGPAPGQAKPAAPAPKQVKPAKASALPQ